MNISTIICYILFLGWCVLYGVITYKYGFKAGANATIVNVLKDNEILKESDESRETPKTQEDSLNYDETQPLSVASAEWRKLKSDIERAVEEGKDKRYDKETGINYGKYWVYENILTKMDLLDGGI